MDFELNDEQRMLRDAVERLVAKEYGFEQRRRHQRQPDGWSRAFWTALAEQGVLALPFAEADGGLGAGPVESMLVMEALGRGLVLEPYLSSVVTAGSLLDLAASPAQKAAWLPPLIAGEQVTVAALCEPQSRYDLADVASVARRDGEDYLLDGDKIVVLHGAGADALLVPARTAGARRDRDGISLFRVAADAAGLQSRRYRTQDGLQACDLRLRQVRVPADARLGEEGGALAVLERAAERSIAALAAEAVGCMQAVLDMTVDYLGQRQQFGGPIGRFQALQHRAAEMLVELEQARSMAVYAALMVDDADAAARARAMSMVKVQIARSGRVVGQLGIQLHGGIGVSEEYAVGHYVRRLTMIEALFGDEDHHLARLAD